MFHPTPWHFWPVLTVAFIWHLIGVIDYTATQLQLDFWMAMVTDRQETFIVTMPGWVDGAWAVSAWLGLLGVILAAFRVGFAPLILSLSFLAMLAVTIWLMAWSEPNLPEISGILGVAIMVGATTMSLLLWLYVRAMHKGGVID